MKLFVCIDIGGTAIKYGLLEKNGSIIEKNSICTEGTTKGGAGILEKIKCIVEEYLNKNEIDGVCISTAGIVDCENGIILYANSNNIKGYTGINIKKFVQETFNIKCEVENDVNCVGLGEHWIGGGIGSKNMVCLTIGTGIGGAIVLDGKVLTGCSGSAGEVGYMKIMGENFEDVASTTALIKAICKDKKIQESTLEGREIIKMYEEGDTICIKNVELLAQNLAKGIANICYTINPDVVVLGGGIMARHDIFIPKIKKYLANELMEIVYKNTSIQFAKLQNDAGMVGALRNFLNK